MQRQEVVQLWSDYNNFWLRTGNIQKVRQSGRPIRTKKLTEERYRLFCDLVDWCREKGLDPRLWLFALFRARRWTYAPQLTPGSMMSENLLKKYERVIERGALDGYRLYKEGTKTGLDPNVDLIPGAEAKKRAWQQSGQSEMCLLMVQSDTYGFHPKSRWCQQCPLQSECQIKLQNSVDFDIQALRRGELTVAQAREAARRA